MDIKRFAEPYKRKGSIRSVARYEGVSYGPAHAAYTKAVAEGVIERRNA